MSNFGHSINCSGLSLNNTTFNFNNGLGNSISNNTFIINSKGSAITGGSINSNLIENNSIFLNGSKSVGIDLVNSRIDVYRGNNIYSSSNLNNRGINLLLSGNNYFCCNYINNVDIGIQFNGNCGRAAPFDDANVKNFTFTNNNTGLYLYNATIEEQPYAGNLWSGGGNKAELYLSGSPSSSDYVDAGQENLFTVNPNQSGTRPQNIVPSTLGGNNWFKSDGSDVATTCANTPDCGVPTNPFGGGGGSPGEEHPWPDTTGGINPTTYCSEAAIQYLITTIQNNNGGWSGNPYSEQEQWQIDYYIYTILATADPNYWQHCSSLVSFMNSATTVAQYYAIATGIDGAYDPTPSEETSLTALQSQMDSDMTALDNIYDQISDENDYLGYESQINTLNASIASTSSSIGQIQTTITTRGQSNLYTITTQINGLPEVYAFHPVLKSALKALAKVSRDGAGILTSAQWAALRSIADGCPLLDGEAVIIARGLLAMVEYREYDDLEDICEAAVGSKRLSSKNEDVAEPGIRCYPNPNSGAFTLVLPKSDHPYQVSIMDMTGREIYTETIDQKQEVAHNIYLRDVETGIYILKVSSNDRVLDTQKIVMIR